MKQPSFKRYIAFWLSQSVSQLGSSMTSFALILWAYEKTGSAMSVSLMSFCRYLPYILVSLFAGAFVDSHRKKSIMPPQVPLLSSFPALRDFWISGRFMW